LLIYLTLFSKILLKKFIRKPKKNPIKIKTGKSIGCIFKIVVNELNRGVIKIKIKRPALGL